MTPREFEGTVKVMNTDRGRKSYDITKIREVTNSTSGASMINTLPATVVTSLATGSISPNSEAVNYGCTTAKTTVTDW